MMTRMPEMSRRAVLRLGSGAAAGALGAYAMDRLLPGRPPVATPVVMTGTGIPLAPHPPLEPVARADDGDRFVRVRGAWWSGHQLGHRTTTRSDQTASTGDRAARQGQ